MSARICIDIGGTFTDLYLRDSDGTGISVKTPTTYDDLTNGLIEAIEKAAAERSDSIESLLGATERLIHGTTIATNAILEDEAADTALICTKGFRDVLTFREGGKEQPYEVHMDYPEPYIPRSKTYGVEERLTAEGDVVTPLDEADVQDAIERIEATGCDAVAVALLWAHVNPIHEQRIGELLEATDLDYALSHEVNPIVREYRRTSSTAIDASLLGPIQDYMSRVNDRLTAAGYDGEPLIITANGGVMQTDEIARRPIWTVDSGPTMLPVAAHEFVKAELGRENVVALDMGGTSLDMGVVREGTIPRTREAEVGESILGIEKVEVKSIGSGGGSIAWVDEGGLLHVGPQSAGAEPGPACYGRGGEEATLTDAALVLGYLNEDYFLGGEMTIDREAAERAIADSVGDEFGLDVTEAAHSIYTTANHDIVNGVREVTIERGIDPRRYVLAGGGGALGFHAVPVARELQISDILLPREAGVVSSIGGIYSDVTRDFSASHFTESDRFDREGVNDVLESLESQAESFFDRVGVPERDRSLSYYTEARYPQQIWEIEVELPGRRLSAGDREELVRRFHEAHETTYGYKMEEQEAEFLYWRIEASAETTGGVEETAVEAIERDLEDARHGQRNAYFDGERMESPAYRGDRLSPDHVVDGPAIVDAKNSTVVLPPGCELTVTEFGNYHITP